ncbi:MAG: hypothetical protein AAF226_06860, partial [Verrucomicrobiota bacterium]
TTLKNRNSELKAEVQKHHQLEVEATKQFNELESQISDWEKKFNELSDKHEQLIATTGTLESLQTRVRDEQTIVNQLHIDKTEIQSFLATSQKEHNTVTCEVDSGRQELKTYQAQIRSAVSKLEDLEEAAQTEKKKALKSQEDLEDANRRIESLRKLEMDLDRSVERRQNAKMSRRGIYSKSDAPEQLALKTEEQICRQLVSRVDLLDDLYRQFRRKPFYRHATEQLGILKNSFIDLLAEHSVDKFDLEPGTELSIDHRKQIQLIQQQKNAAVAKKSGGARSRVVETVRSGYIYRRNGKDVIIRKAEVVVG